MSSESAAARITRRIGRDSAVVSVAGAVTRVAPLLSTVMIASTFGAGSALDVYYVALIVPVILAGLLGMAITTVFVPVLVEERERAPGEYGCFVGSILFAVLAAGLVLTAGFAASCSRSLPLLLRAFDPGHQKLGVRLALELAPMIALVTMRSTLTSAYHAQRRFLLPTLALSVPPVAMIAALVTLGDRLGIEALVLGNVAGHALEVMLLSALGPLLGLPRLLPVPRWDDRLRAVAAISAPQIISGAVLRLNPLVDRSMAAMLTAGSVSALVYAERMQSVPLQILGIGFMGVLLAHWSLERAENGIADVARSLAQVQRALVRVFVPLLVFAWLFRRELVSLVLERGALDGHGASRVATVFGVYVFGVLPLLITQLYVRVMLVLKETGFLMRVGLFNAVSNVSLNAVCVFVLGLGVEGIALSTVITSWVILFMLGAAVSRRVGFIPPAVARRDLPGIAIGLAFAFVATFALSGVTENLPLLPRMITAFGAFAAAYLIGVLYFAADLPRLRRREADAL